MAGEHYPNRASHARSQKAFWDIWYAHEESLRRLCASICRGSPDDAEDLLRAAMTRAWDHWEADGPSLGKPGAWLRELTRNVSLSHRRSEHRRKILLRDAVGRQARADESVEEAAYRRELLAEALQIIDRMPSSIREPFMAYALYGQSYAEVAQTYGIREATARQRVAKARQILAAALAEGTTPRRAVQSERSDRSDDADVVGPLRDEIAWNLRDTCVIHVKLPTGGTLEYHAAFEHGLGRRKQRIKTLERYVAHHERGWRKRFELANLLIAESRVEEAERHLRRVLELQPHHLPSALRLGELLVLERRLDDAVAVYEQAQRHASSLAARLHLEGLKQRALAGAVFPQYAVAQRAEHLERAVEAFRAAIAEDPRNLAHYHELGLTYDAWGKPREALAAYDAALRIDPEDVFALARGHNPMLAQGMYGPTLPRLERAVALDPNYTYALKLLVDRRARVGLVRGAEGRRTLALARRLVERNPDSADALDAMGHFYYFRGERDRTVALWREFVERHTENAKAWTFYATALEWYGDDEGAAEAYIRSHQLDPGWLDVYWRGLQVLIRTGRHDEARRWIKELAERFPDHWDSCSRVAEYSLSLGDIETALAYGQRSVELAPDIEASWRLYGRLLLRAGRPAEALEALQRADEAAPLRTEPRLAITKLMMGRALNALGRSEEAAMVLREAARLFREAHPVDPFWKYHIGYVFMEFGDLERAERTFRRAEQAGWAPARFALSELQEWRAARQGGTPGAPATGVSRAPNG